ncbi:MAG: ABC transporter ATP-binding protein [Gemmatimonadales bacterium]|nr:ABC transporter ATP-binding protein [Gemmatimonadales bacterium]
MTTLLEVRDATRRYRSGARAIEALRGVTLSIARGDYVAVVGPSGSGKSTLLTLLGGLDAPTSGQVRLEGVDYAQLDDRARTRLRLERIGFVFQRFHLLPVLTALENVELPMAERGIARAVRRERAAELLGYVGLADRVDNRATELSGGEMQRVAIARALANDPAIILADEPTGELDEATGADILALFRRLHADGRTLVVVTHDARLAREAARTLTMRDGRLVS